MVIIDKIFINNLDCAGSSDSHGSRFPSAADDRKPDSACAAAAACVTQKFQQIRLIPKVSAVARSIASEA
jgi:hypothetical protein